MKRGKTFKNHQKRTLRPPLLLYIARHLRLAAAQQLIPNPFFFFFWSWFILVAFFAVSQTTTVFNLLQPFFLPIGQELASTYAYNSTSIVRGQLYEYRAVAIRQILSPVAYTRGSTCYLAELAGWLDSCCPVFALFHYPCPGSFSSFFISAKYIQRH